MYSDVCVRVCVRVCVCVCVLRRLLGLSSGSLRLRETHHFARSVPSIRALMEDTVRDLSRRVHELEERERRRQEEETDREQERQRVVLPDGTRVKIDGLVGAAHLNGKEGTIVQWIDDRGRYMVDVDGVEIRKGLNADNLTKLHVPSQQERLLAFSERAARDVDILRAEIAKLSLWDDVLKNMNRRVSAVELERREFMLHVRRTLDEFRLELQRRLANVQANFYEMRANIEHLVIEVQLLSQRITRVRMLVHDHRHKYRILAALLRARGLPYVDVPDGPADEEQE